MKKFVALLLIITNLFMLSCVPASASGNNVGAGEVTAEQIEKAMEHITEAVKKIDELKDAAGSAESIASTFSEFMKVAGYVGTTLSVVNGSITFLKLIGIMDDPVKEGVNSILDQLRTVNDKMSEMDTKLDTMASAMTTMQASAEFNNRGIKAQAMCSAWNTFEYNYMENGLDPLMAQYNGMLINGIKSWCENATENARKAGGVDNSRVMILYLKDADGQERPYFFDGNEIPAQYAAEGRYVILEKACLPDSFSFNINDYQKKLAEDIAARIKNALNTDNYDAFSSKGFEMLTPEGKALINDVDIQKLAADAVEVLSYRIGCVEVNRDATFAITVNDRFANYCAHLFAAGEGVDAMLKSFYLTHAFEFEVKADLADFINRMILKTGTYGTFVTNVLGMSDATLDNTKLAAMARFVDAVDTLNETLDGCVTGNDKYSYITGTELRYTDLDVTVRTTVNTEHIYNDKINYLGYVDGVIKTKVNYVTPGGYDQLGDVNTLVLLYTLQNNGVNDIHNYLNKNATRYYVRDHGKLVSSFGREQTMALDGGISMKVKNITGNDFDSINTYALTGDKSKYPDDAKPTYIYNNKKLCGTVIDAKTGSVTSNSALMATAVYGQTHWYWFFDEAAVFIGPAGNENISVYTSQSHGKFDYADEVSAEGSYNTIVSIPIDEKLSTVGAGYDPLASFAELNAQIEAENNGFSDPSEPQAEYPQVSSASELDLTGTVWGRSTDADSEDVLEACKELTENALTAAGFDADSLTEAEKEQIAAKAAKTWENAAEKLNENGAVYENDPLGIASDKEALKTLAEMALPDYLLDENFRLGDDVKYLFLRNYCEAIPVVSFAAENGRPTAETGVIYSVTPYLIAGEVSGGSFEVLCFAITQEQMNEMELSLNVRLPANDMDSARIVCYDKAQNGKKLATVSATVIGSGKDRCAEFVSPSGAFAYEVCSTGDSPVTDDGRAVWCFALTALIALAALMFCEKAYGKNNRKHT